MNFNFQQFFASRNTKIISAVIGLVLVVVAGFFTFQAVAGRAAGEKPESVQITNITQNSATVTWTSSGETQCSIPYGTSQTSLNFFAVEENPATTHKVDLTLLSPETTYYLKIRCGEQEYDNAGAPWTFTTLGQSSPTPQPVASPSAAVTPEPTVTPSAATPTPVSSVQTTPAEVSCVNETDCEKIKQNLGKGEGCDTQAYFKCVKKATPTP